MKHSHNFKDVTGHQYGFLTAVKCVGVKETYNKKSNRIIKRPVWLFKCHCGKEIKRTRSEVESCQRHGLTISCGCESFKHKRGNKHGLWKGFGEISKQYFTRTKRGAKKRNLEFNVTLEYLWNLFLKQNKKCALTDEDINFGSATQKQNNSFKNQTASLDRIDSSKGYVEGNVQWVHKYINNMKWDLTQNEFIEWCRKVSIKINQAHGA
jgi:hypothetical protein